MQYGFFYEFQQVEQSHARKSILLIAITGVVINLFLTAIRSALESERQIQLLNSLN